MKTYTNRQKTEKIVKKYFDDTSIMLTLLKLKIDSSPMLTPSDQMVMQAFERYSPNFQDAPPAEIGHYLEGMNHEQLLGVVSNVKGILHEMIYAQFENHSGSLETATLFHATNHPGYDITEHNNLTGKDHLVQLKATDDAASVKDWMAHHPNGDIVVTSELADKMHLHSSGISDKDLTVKVDHFVDKMVHIPDDNALWQHFPILTFTSICIVSYELIKRHKQGEISKDALKIRIAAVAGTKLLKFGVIMALMTVPVVNVAVGAVLIARILLALNQLSNMYLAKVNQHGTK